MGCILAHEISFDTLWLIARARRQNWIPRESVDTVLIPYKQEILAAGQDLSIRITREPRTTQAL